LETAFCTERGRQDLCESAKVSRIVLIILGYGHTFGSLEDIQAELSPKIIELSPILCANYYDMPFMTAGNDIGQKSLIDIESKDKISGMILQDIKSNDTMPGVAFRQVIFEDKSDQIQSEV
jgi:hypothetical protein